MRSDPGMHIFMDMDETLLKGRALTSFNYDDFVYSKGSIIADMIKVRKDWSSLFTKDIEDEKHKHLRSGFEGSDKEYKAYLWNLVMESRVVAEGWKVLWFSPYEAIAVFPRPQYKEFLTEVSKLGKMHICSTATRDYAMSALTDALGVSDMFENIFTREDIYPDGIKRGACPGWKWDGSPSFVLVDDQPYHSDAIYSKRKFLGVPPRFDFLPLLVSVYPFEGWNSKDEVLMKEVLPDLINKFNAVKEGLCPTSTNTVQTA